MVYRQFFGFDFFLYFWTCELLHLGSHWFPCFGCNIFPVELISSGSYWSNDISQHNNIELKVIHEMNELYYVHSSRTMQCLHLQCLRIVYNISYRESYFFFRFPIIFHSFLPLLFSPLFEFTFSFRMESGNSTKFTSQWCSD